MKRFFTAVIMVSLISFSIILCLLFTLTAWEQFWEGNYFDATVLGIAGTFGLSYFGYCWWVNSSYFKRQKRDGTR